MDVRRVGDKHSNYDMGDHVSSTSGGIGMQLQADRASYFDYLAGMISELKALAQQGRSETLEDILEIARREAVREKNRQ